MCIISWDNCRHLFLITANTHVALKKLMRKQELTASINNRTSIYILCAQKSSHWSDKSKDLTTFREYRYLASYPSSKIPVSIQPFVWTTLKVRKKDSKFVTYDKQEVVYTYMYIERRQLRCQPFAYPLQ